MNDNLKVDKGSLPKPHPDDRTIQQKFYDSQMTVMILREEVLKDKKYIEESKKLLADYIASFDNNNVNAARFHKEFIKVMAEHTKYNNSLK